MPFTTSTSWGALLVNLGTPDAPRIPEVRRYLAEFLSDPDVIDIPAPARWLLLHLVILPFRPRRSAEAYEKIWLPEGSPLLVHGKALAAQVRERLGPSRPVALAMRYGRPSIASGLRALAEQGVRRVVVLPLYPQYAHATTRSTVERVRREAVLLRPEPDLRFIGAFHDAPEFIGSFEAVGRPILEAFRPDHVLLSYHGLPERQVIKADPTGAHCLKAADCCERFREANPDCYRGQCFATSRALAEALELERWSVSFQSRLGRDRWIAPFTDRAVLDLAARGVRRLAVLCPAFVADCLETLEEIGIRARASFLAVGGEAFTLVPSLNSHPRWADAVAGLIRREIGAG